MRRDLDTNQHFTLKTNPLKDADLAEFVNLFKSENRALREETWSEANPDGRWRAYSYEQSMAQDKANLDIFWLRDESLDDAASLEAPEADLAVTS